MDQLHRSRWGRADKTYQSPWLASIDHRSFAGLGRSHRLRRCNRECSFALKFLCRQNTALVFHRRRQQLAYKILAILFLKLSVLRSLGSLKAAITHLLKLPAGLFRDKFAGLRRPFTLIIADINRRDGID